MKTGTIEIVDRGRGPQLSTTRITVLDIFYYLHRGYEFADIQQIIPTLSRAEFDVVMDYVRCHRDELVEKDRQAEEFIRTSIEAQQARGGLFAAAEENLTTEERVARLKAKMQQHHTGKKGEGNPA